MDGLDLLRKLKSELEIYPSNQEVTWGSLYSLLDDMIREGEYNNFKKQGHG